MDKEPWGSTMLYLVRAQPKVTEMTRFWGLLNNGTIEAQQPDGSEIVASMRRAVINGDKVEWQETCYCNPPLRHERTTVYDQFFTNMETLPLVDSPSHKGGSFWHYLEDGSRKKAGASTQATISVGRYIPVRIF
jgi:hypothetical protein